MSSQPYVRRGSDGRVLPSRWMIYQVASSQTWIGEMAAWPYRDFEEIPVRARAHAATEAEAVKKAAEKFNLRTAKLMAVRRSAARSS